MLRSTFMGFEASKTAIFANQKSIDIVGNNIANAQTTGYTKQRVERASLYISNYSNRTASSTVGLAGLGVDSLGVSQTRDAFLDKCFRDEYSEASYYGQQGSMIDDILNVFPEAVDVTDTSGILGALENLYTNLNTYIQSPTLESEANLVKSAFTNMIQVLQQADTRLTTVSDRQKEDLGTTVDRTNEVLDRIAYINKIVASDASITGNTNSDYFLPNELADERNLLLDELAGYSDISVNETSKGVISVKMGDQLVVDEFETDHLILNTNGDEVSWVSTGDKVQFNSGSIKAYINVINGRGANAGADIGGSGTTNETSTQGVLYYRDRINLLAQKLADIANTSIPETVTEDGVTYNKLATNLDGSPVLEESGTAAAAMSGSALDAVNWKDTNPYDGTESNLAGKELSVTVNGVTKTVTFKAGGTASDTELDIGSAASFSDLLKKAGENLLTQFGKDNTVAAVRNADFTAVSGSISFNVGSDGKISATGEVGTGKPVTVYKTLLTGKDTLGNDSTDTVTAANIKISDAWNNSGASYFIYDGKENVEDYAQKLSARLSEKSSDSDKAAGSIYKNDQVFKSYGEKFEGTFNEYMIEMVGRLGTDVSFNKGRQEASAQVADDFLESRDAVAGVQQDEETTNLMIYQKAFSAASRVMTTMDDLLDIVINKMGRCGL